MAAFWGEPAAAAILSGGSHDLLQTSRPEFRTKGLGISGRHHPIIPL
jgi:hypothetical protein